MIGSLVATGALSAAPSPSDGFEFTVVSVSPGLGGFIAMFFLALAVVALIVSMTRHVRRVNATYAVREEQERAQQREQEQRAQQDEQGRIAQRDTDADTDSDGQDGGRG